MSFEFIQRSLNLPSLMIQSRQFSGRRCFVIKNRRDQTIDGLCTLNSSNRYSITRTTTPFSFMTLMYSADVRAIGKPLFTGQTAVFLDSPEQIRTLYQSPVSTIQIRRNSYPQGTASPCAGKSALPWQSDFPCFIAPIRVPNKTVSRSRPGIRTAVSERHCYHG